MASQFEPSGVELIAKGLGQFLSDLNTANKAIANVGSQAGGAASSAIAPFTSLGNSILDLGAKATMVAAGGFAALGLSVAAVTAKGTEMALNLEQGMADLLAISGDTAAEVAPLKDLIGELALDPKLKVTTDEATQALYALTKQGLEVTDIMAGAGEATVALANATGSNFNTAGTLAAGVMKAWNMEASNLGPVIDGITGVLTNSKFSIDDYNLAFSQGGGIAAAYGVSLEDFNTIIAGTSGIFASGSDAGTSFKTMMMRLAAPTKEAKAVIDQYGISLYNADGSMRDMREVAAQLNTVMEGSVTVTSTVGGVTEEVAEAAKHAAEEMPDLTQTISEQATKLDILKGEYGVILQHYDANSTKARNAALAIDSLTYDYNKNIEKLGEYETAIGAASGATERQVTSTKTLTEAEKARLTEAIGGADAARMLVALGAMTAEEYDALSAKVNANGQAFNAAAIRMDTAKGALEIFQGILEAIQIQIGERFTPMVRRMAEAASGWASSSSGSIIDFFGSIADGVDGFINNIGKIFGVFSRFGVKGASRSIMGILGFDQESITAVTSTIDTIVAEVSRIQTVFENFGVSGVAFSIGGLLGLDSDSMIAIQSTITEIIAGITSFAESVKTAMVGIGFEEFKGALLAVGAVFAGGLLAAIVAGLLSLLTPINLIIAGAALLGAAWAGNWGGIQETVVGIITYVTDLSTSLMEVLIPAFNTVWSFISTNIMPLFSGELPASLGIFGGTLSRIKDGFNEFLVNLQPVQVHFQMLVEAFQASLPGLQTMATIIGGVLLGAIIVLGEGIAAILPTIGTIFSGVFGTVASIISGAALAISGFYEFVAGIFTGDFPRLTQGFVQMWQGLGVAVVGAISSLGGMLFTVLSQQMERLQDVFWGLYDVVVGNSIIPDMVNEIIKWFKSLPQKILNVLGDLTTKVTKPFMELGEILSEEVGEAFSYFTDDLLPLFNEGLLFVIESIKDMIGYFNAMKEAVSSFSLPDILTPGSPPPMAYALWDIGKGADAAASAIGGMGNAMSGVNPKEFLDAMDVGASMHALGASNVNDLKDIFKLNSQAAMDILSSGGGANELNALVMQQAQIWNVPPQFASDLAQANGLFDQLIANYGEFARATSIENLGRKMDMAGRIATLSGTFTDMLADQMGSSEEAAKILADYTKSIATATDKLTDNQDKLGIEQRELDLLDDKLLEQQAEFEALTAEIAEATLEYGANSEEVQNLLDKSQSLETQMEKTGISVDEKRKKIADLTKAIAENSQAVDDNIAALANAQMDMATGTMGEQIAFLEDFLASGEDTIRLIGEELGGVFAGTGLTSDVFWDRVSAQEELNRLLEEQRRQEELIAASKQAQADLDFLRAQLDLIKLGEELGGDIFAGMNFGLDASVEDMAAATNALVQAMIEQIDEGFDLGSPSRLMYKKFGFVVDGALNALEAGKGMMGKAMGSMLAPMYNMVDVLPGMWGGSSSVTNNYYDMKVNTGASAPAVMQQYSIAKSMYG